jgi:rubrerythrin
MAFPQPHRDQTKDGKPTMESDLSDINRVANDLSSIWICLGCGYHHMDNDTPNSCPRCTGNRILSAFGDTSDR